MSGDDTGPDAGKRPPFAKPLDDGRGAIGTGEGYSGQEHDSRGQADWRARQKSLGLPDDGAAEGSGAGAGGGDPGEDYDIGTPGGARPEGSA